MYSPIERVIAYSESEISVQLAGTGVRLREGFRSDLFKLLSTSQPMKIYLDIFRVVTNYTKAVFDSWEQNSGDIDGFIKGYLTYEVSCALNMVYPVKNIKDVHKELIDYFKIDLNHISFDTRIVLTRHQFI